MKIKHTVTTKEGIDSLPYGAGYAVGTIAAEIPYGKSSMKRSILVKTKQDAEFLKKI